MIKIELFNRSGNKLTEVNIREQEEKVDGIQWGGKTFIFDPEKGHYRESNIVPAIIKS